MKKFRTTHKKLLSLLLAVIMLLSIAPANLFSVTASAVSGSEIVAYARQFLGYQYVYGTAGPNTFDCSGFTKYVFGHFGISLPHSTYTLWNNSTSYGMVVATGSTANAKAGDLILWEGHVAIYTENGYCVEALNENYDVTDKVKVDSHKNGMNYKVIRVYGVSDNVSIPGNPTNLTTTNGAKKFTTAESISFKWDAVSGATEYWIYMWKDGTQLYQTNMGNATAFTSAPTSAGKYTFIVRAGNSAGHSGGVSFSFDVVENKIPDAPTGLMTTNGRNEFSTKESISFKWNESKRATEYWVYMWKDGKQLYQTNMGNNTSFTSAPTSAGEYTLIVRAGNTAGFGSDGASFKFTVYDPNQTFNITYNPNGGENAPANQTKKYGESITLSSTVPTRDEYNFLGWSTDKNATVPEYLPGDIYSENKELTLYAVWEEAKETKDIMGTIKTFGDPTDEVYVDFYKPGESESCGYTIFRGDAEEYCIGGIQQGEYIIKISKPNHVTREYSVVVDKDIELDIQLNLIGDVDGNGKVNITDYNAILRHVKKTGTLDGYSFDCADIDGNGKILVTDYNSVLRHVKKTELLW